MLADTDRQIQTGLHNAGRCRQAYTMLADTDRPTYNKQFKEWPHDVTNMMESKTKCNLFCQPTPHPPTNPLRTFSAPAESLTKETDCDSGRYLDHRIHLVVCLIFLTY